MVDRFIFYFIEVIVIVAVSAYVVQLFYLRPTKREAAQPSSQAVNIVEPPGSTDLSRKLAAALPECVILPQDLEAYNQSTSTYWAQQECESLPACVVRPQNVPQLCKAVTIIKQEFDDLENQDSSASKSVSLFAVRSGGHSHVSGAASLKGGVLVDMSLFCEVIPSQDGKSVVIGTGARWADVSKVLDERGLAVAGGRNSNVGVGGLTLGGGLSFFSPRYGLVCSNIISYSIILASGKHTTASSTRNPDLWRALKGGSNNFGIVTHFTARAFPSTQIWSGFLYMASFQAPKVLGAFHAFVARADPREPAYGYDNHAAGPIACFTYVGKLGIQAISVNIVYTKLPENVNQWPACWKTSSFSKLWRFWSTCKIRTLTSATDELNALNPPGSRQENATTTVKNDAATLDAVYRFYSDALAEIKNAKVKDLDFTLVLQPMLGDWVRLGDPSPLGLSEGPHEPLVIVSFTVNWREAALDDFARTTTREAIGRIEKFAVENGTGHRYRYLNYCAGWQRPFEGYGEENWRWLREMSRKWDPEGLFQRGCAGGFKVLDGAEKD